MTPNARSILILAFSDHLRDPRVNRQIAALKDRFEVKTCGSNAQPAFEVAHFQLTSSFPPPSPLQRIKKALRLKARRFDEYYWAQPRIRQALEILAGQSPDIILCNDILSLPLALRLGAKTSKVWLDAHEYEPRHWETLAFKIFFADYWDYICRKYLPDVDYMTTVGNGIAAEYRKCYRSQCDVITSAPAYEEISPSPVDPDKIRLIHHGASTRVRKLENMIELMALLDPFKFSLDLMLVPTDSRYHRKLERLAAEQTGVDIIDPVPMPSITKTISGYDIGLYMIPPATFNLRMALPNKFFEFIQARLMLATWPLTEMRPIIESEGIGLCTEQFTVASMANALNALTPGKIANAKLRSNEAATFHSAEVNEGKLVAVARELVGSGS